MFERSWVRIPVPYTGWIFRHFFTLICCKNCIVCVKRGGPIFKKKKTIIDYPHTKGNYHTKGFDIYLRFSVIIIT